jgi:hypothetical protein
MVVGNAFDEAQRLGAGVLLFAGEKIEPLLVNAHKGRIALGVELSGPVSDWLADDVLGAMLELRASRIASALTTSWSCSPMPIRRGSTRISSCSASSSARASGAGRTRSSSSPLIRAVGSTTSPIFTGKSAWRRVAHE